MPLFWQKTAHSQQKILNIWLLQIIFIVLNDILYVKRLWKKEKGNNYFLYIEGFFDEKSSFKNVFFPQVKNTHELTFQRKIFQCKIIIFLTWIWKKNSCWKKTLICSNFTLKWENHVPCIPSFQAIVRKRSVC